jgi:hypothetical protein
MQFSKPFFSDVTRNCVGTVHSSLKRYNHERLGHIDATYGSPGFKFLTVGIAIARAGLRPVQSRKKPSCRH